MPLLLKGGLLMGGNEASSRRERRDERRERQNLKIAPCPSSGGQGVRGVPLPWLVCMCLSWLVAGALNMHARRGGGEGRARA